MAQHIQILGWVDPEAPGRRSDGGSCYFRLKLSDTPSAAWRKSYGDHDKNRDPSEILEKDVLSLNCGLNEIEGAVERVRRRLDITNRALAELDREFSERAVRQKNAEEESRQEILAAVSRIHFGNEALRAAVD